MGLRDEIIRQAKWWAAPGTYKPTADDFATIIQQSRVNSVDGNQAGNTIVEYTNWKHTVSSIVAYYTLVNE